MILLMLTNVVETMAGKHPMDALREDGSGFYKGDEAVLFLSGPNITGAASIQNLHIPTNQVDEGFFANTRTAVFSFSQYTLKYCCTCWTYLIIRIWLGNGHGGISVYIPRYFVLIEKVFFYWIFFAPAFEGRILCEHKMASLS